MADSSDNRIASTIADFAVFVVIFLLLVYFWLTKNFWKGENSSWMWFILIGVICLILCYQAVIAGIRISNDFKK